MRSSDELQKVVVSYLAMHVVTNQQPNLMRVLDALRFPISTVKAPGWGDLPVTRIGLSVGTHRPSDTVMIDSAELTGVDAFEEVVSVDELAAVSDPFRQSLIALAREHMPGRLPA